ncbi:hypothetical protein BSKO_00300 [Bryopsis sp. KO-2023]|nr:hypothetical protein BSKO_00300 [Bryopsis sp. KO-2023]
MPPGCLARFPTCQQVSGNLPPRIIRPSPFSCPSPSGAAFRRNRVGVRNHFLDAPDLQSTSQRSAGATRIHCSSAVGEQESLPEPSSGGLSAWIGPLAIGSCVVAAIYGLAQTSLAAGLHAQVMASWLGKSGFVAALSLIFLSEIGDKTFFIAALLAMRLGRWVSFLGTAFALGLTSILSVGIGVLFNAVPDAMKQSVPVGEYLGVALLLFFGFRSLRAAWLAKPAGADGEEKDGELADAEEALREAEESGKVAGKTSWKSFMEVVSLVFVGEWGDRSMLATIALGAAQNPVGVATGAVVAHVLAAALAVIGGALVGKFVSEKGVNFISGGLFIVFAIATMLGLS